MGSRYITVLMAMVFIGTIGILGGMLYRQGDIFPPKVPLDRSEMAKWSSYDLGRLSRALDCAFVPNVDKTEHGVVTDWRQLCNKINEYYTHNYYKERAYSILKNAYAVEKHNVD